MVKGYAEDCYKQRDFVPARCTNTFVKSKIQVTAEQTECPWAPSMCPAGALPAVSMDSGVVDQGSLGFNVRAEDGVKFRKKTVCSVLPVEPYFSVSNASLFESTLARDALSDEEIGWLRYYADQTKVTFSQSLFTTSVSEQYGSK